MQPKSFASDNYAGIHPKILEAIINANVDHEKAYGADRYTQQAVDLFKQHFGKDIDVYFVLTGTAANVLSLQTVLSSHQAIICTDIAHINVDECGAPEKFIGCKLLTVPHNNGKLTINALKALLDDGGNQHKVQPKIISITQPTELGTVYNLEEIKKITDFAHQNNLLVHVDGARLCNAIVHLGIDFKSITTTGVDMLSFGGTKNGMMLGEAVIFFNKSLSEQFKYIRKQGMQLISKMRFISAQFMALLADNLWLENASHANRMAGHLSDELGNIAPIKIPFSVQTNAVFIELDPQLIKMIQQNYNFYIWNTEGTLARLMTSFDTTERDIHELVSAIQQIVTDYENKHSLKI